MSHATVSHRRDTEKISPPANSLLHHHHGLPRERADVIRKPDVDAASVNRLRSLLVPLDGTLNAEHALPHALAIARRSGAVVRLARVHSRFDHAEAWQIYPSEAALERRKQEKQEYLRDVADRIRRIVPVAVETILVESCDTEGSLAMAAENADLVVMASRRRGLLRRLLSYSVTAELRRRLRVPVLLVRGYPTPVNLASDPFARHVLVPLDGSPLAERILDPVKIMGRLATPKLTLVNVQNDAWTNGAFEHATPPGYLAGTARGVKDVLPLVDACIVTTHKPIAKALASFAERQQVNLIAPATHADGGWNRWLRGSVVDALLRQTDLPILTMSVDAERCRPEIMTVVGA